MDLVKVLSEQQLKSDLPELKIGDTVKVHAKIKEGNRERIQVFEGIIIAKKKACPRCGFQALIPAAGPAFRSA